MLTLVIYDISDDRDRSKLAELLMNYGLERIQYSGFKGMLNTHDRLMLAKEVKRFVKGDRDSIYLIRLCRECASLCQIISKKEIVLVNESDVKIL
ncbi:MAG: CRISPR-associated endonuclease Cas2 [Nitrososphaerales archaeon]